jgi:hypothetical protein
MDTLEQALARVTAERDAALAKLNGTRCNAGHDTLPLVLWDCPACHDKTRAERDAVLDALHEIIYCDHADGAWYGSREGSDLRPFLGKQVISLLYESAKRVGKRDFDRAAREDKP